MGGNAFEGTVPLLEKHKIDFLNLVKRDLEPKFLPYAVGSAGNFGAKQSYNDVDFVIEADDAHWADFVSHINNTYEKVKKITNQCYSVMKFSAYTDEYHQVDFMRSRDLHWSVNVFHSPYGKSNYKSAHRNILLMAMVKVCTQKVHNIGNDRFVRTRQHLDLYDGLVYMVQSKSRNAIRYTTLDKITVDLDFLSAIMRFMPVEGSVHIDSFESVYDFMFKHFYKDRGDQKTWLAILREAKEMIISAKLKMPTEIGVWIEVPESV